MVVGQSPHHGARLERGAASSASSGGQRAALLRTPHPNPLTLRSRAAAVGGGVRMCLFTTTMKRACVRMAVCRVVDRERRSYPRLACRVRSSFGARGRPGGSRGSVV